MMQSCIYPFESYSVCNMPYEEGNSKKFKLRMNDDDR